MKHTCNCNQLCTSRITLFEPLSQEEQKELIAKTQHLDYKKGDMIFSESEVADKIMIVRYGKIKINRYSLEGKEYVLDILAEGDVYGEQNIFSEKSLEVNAVSLSETGVCLISHSDIQDLMRKRLEIGIKILNVIGKKLFLTNELVQLLSLNDAKARVAGFILLRSSRMQGSAIELTREDMAAYINVRRETISRKLGELQREGAIRLEGNKKIQIQDIDMLREIFENGD